MNKINGFNKNEASASTSLSSSERRSDNIRKDQQQQKHQHPLSTSFSSSALPTFLKWFRKDDQNRNLNNKSNNGSISSKEAGDTSRGFASLRDSTESGRASRSSSSSSSSSSLNLIFGKESSRNSSCDSIISTSTAGFYYIPPQNYPNLNNINKNHNNNNNFNKLNKVITDIPETDSYRRRLRRYNYRCNRPSANKSSISIKDKYLLYEADTLKSIDIREQCSSSATAAGESENGALSVKRNNIGNDYDNLEYIDSSLSSDTLKDSSESAERIRTERNKCRRSVSDNSKDKKSGIYVHVKGKRRAPPPPPPEAAINNNSLGKKTNLPDCTANEDAGKDSKVQESSFRSLTSSNRRKRRAPPPPPLNTSLKDTTLDNDKLGSGNLSARSTLGQTSSSRESPIKNSSIYSEGSLLDESDIKSLLAKEAKGNLIKSENSLDADVNNPVDMPSHKCNEIVRERNPISSGKNSLGRRESIKASKSGDRPRYIPPGILNLTKAFSSNSGETKASENEPKKDTSAGEASNSQISPRPWYKRPISLNRDSSIPFKREVTLKTMERRKKKASYSSQLVPQIESPMLPENTNSRFSSIFDTSHNKLVFFANRTSMKEPLSSSYNSAAVPVAAKDKEKRKSAIGIPNISELDREAAEIVSKEHANEGKDKTEREKFFQNLLTPAERAPYHLVLQQQMFQKPQIDLNQSEKKNSNEKSENQSEINFPPQIQNTTKNDIVDDSSRLSSKEDVREEPAVISAKELISKFEANSNMAKITINTTFLEGAEKFFSSSSSKVNIKGNIKDIEELQDKLNKNKCSSESRNLQSSSESSLTSSMLTERTDQQEQEKLSPIQESEKVRKEETKSELKKSPITAVETDNKNTGVCDKEIKNLQPLLSAVEKGNQQLNEEDRRNSQLKKENTFLSKIENNNRSEITERNIPDDKIIAANNVPTSKVSENNREWSCERCTFKNHPWKLVCEICLSVKKSLLPPEFKTRIPSYGNNLLTNVNNCNSKIKTALTNSETDYLLKENFGDNFSLIVVNNKQSKFDNSDKEKITSELLLENQNYDKLGKKPHFSDSENDENIEEPPSEMINCLTSDTSRHTSSNILGNNNNKGEQQDKKNLLEEFPNQLEQNQKLENVIVGTRVKLNERSASRSFFQRSQENSSSKLSGNSMKYDLQKHTVENNNNVIKSSKCNTDESLNDAVVITTVTPIAFDSKIIKNVSNSENTSNHEKDLPNADESKVDVKAVRGARLAKFSLSSEKAGSASVESASHHQEDIENSNDNNNNPIIYIDDEEEDNDDGDDESFEIIDNPDPLTIKATAKQEDDSNSKEKQNEIIKVSDNSDLNNTDDDKRKDSLEIEQAKECERKEGAARNKEPFSKNNCNKNVNEDIEKQKISKTSTSAQTSGLVKKNSSPRIVHFPITPEVARMTKLRRGSLQCPPSPKTERKLKRGNVIFNENIDKNKTVTSEALKQTEKKIETNTEDLVNNLGGDSFLLNRVIKDLEEAIAKGNHDLAAQIAKTLAKMKISLEVTKVRSKSDPIPLHENAFNRRRSDYFTMDIPIYTYLTGNPLQRVNLSVNSNMSLREIKQKLFEKYNLPVSKQIWNIEMGKDESYSKNSLYTLGIRRSEDFKGVRIFVEVVNNKNGNSNSSSCDDLQNIDTCNEGAAAFPAPELPTTSKASSSSNVLLNSNGNDLNRCANHRKSIIGDLNVYNKLSLDCPVGEQPKHPVLYNYNAEKYPPSAAAANRRTTAPAAAIINEEKLKKLHRMSNQKDNLKDVLSEAETSSYTRNQLGYGKAVAADNSDRHLYRTLRHHGVFTSRNILNETIAELIPIPEKPLSPILQQITRRRSADVHQPLKEQRCRGKNEVKNRNITEETTADEYNHYLELLKLDKDNVVPNAEEFECPVCLMKFKPGDGIVLRDCLHTFCKECICHTIELSDDAEIKCPYMDVQYSCDSVLQEREIRAIVSSEIYEKHLAKSVRVAEHKIENTFHCKTPNCSGWCIYEDNVNTFFCPVCKMINCLTCRAIHEHISCKEYQDRLDTDSDNNSEARRTKKLLKDMLAKGEAMNCPACQIIVMKKYGCDWLVCSMCKTEICWVTRGPRWGPGGKGDVSAGCRCGVKGKKCHPKCNYCH